MENNKKIKYSINKQLAFSFMLVIVFILVACFITNNLFLEKYYLVKKQRVLVNAYDTLNEADKSNSFRSEEFDDRLRYICDKYSLDVLVVDSESRTIKYMGKDAKELKLNLWQYIFFKNEARALTATDNYEISISADGYSEVEFLDIWGNLDSGKLFIIRTALDSIHESVEISNTFLAYTGLVAIVVSAFIIWYVSRMITKPILDLAKISERLKMLDFEAKYTPSKKRFDEIDVLGENINDLSASLEHTISELKTANNELQRDIEQKMKTDEMRKEFLSNVSHELKTPIAIIQGYAEGLIDGVTDDPDSMKYYCEVIVDETKKMNSMVKNLLSLNQLEFSSDTITLERFDIVLLIKNVISSADILAKQSGIEIQFTENDPIYVWGDEFKVEEIVTNYISNAINHCEYDKKIDIKLELNETKAKIIVFNTGNPIPEDSIERIWDKFYKVDKARTRAYGGSGIGLSIVSAICNAMNTEYGVINYDNGVAFWFELDRK